MDITKKTALVSVIKLVADAGKDVASAIAGGGTLLSKLSGFSNLVGDVSALVPQIGDLSAEIVGLTAADIIELAGVLVSDLAIEDAKAQAIVQASLDLLAELAGPALSKVQTLIAAIEAPAAVAA